jgi:hypothetical protein
MALPDGPLRGLRVNAKPLDGQATHVPACHELHVEFAIRTPGDLTKAIRIVQANIADGTLLPIDQAGVQPFAAVSVDGPWADRVAYHFRCATCGTQFELSAETYHGNGGAWRRRDSTSAV